MKQFKFMVCFVMVSVFCIGCTSTKTAGMSEQDKIEYIKKSREYRNYKVRHFRLEDVSDMDFYR